MCISVGWWLGISPSLTPRRVSGSLLHFPRKSFRLLPLVLPHPLAGSHLPLLDPLLRGQAWVTSNTPTCSHILELLALNRQARKRNKIFFNNKQITYAFPYQVDEYSGTFPPSPPLHPPALLQPAPPIVRRRGWRSWGWRTRLNDLIWLSKEREGAVKKMEGGNREEEEGWQREIGKVKKSAARHPNLPWSLVTRNWPKERPVWILVLLCQICSVISTHNKW